MRFLSSEKLSAHKYKTPEGYLICTDAILARTGKQTYRKNEVFADAEDDSEIEVDRRPEDVFSDETMASFENKPITVEHPNRDVNAENHNELSVGFARDIRRATIDGQDVMIGNLVITDAQTIEEIENGEHCELSCGYDCDIEDENNPVQKNIRGNHIALCERGRAGIARIVDSETVNNKLNNNELAELAKQAERANTQVELEKVVDTVLNYDRTLFRELSEAMKKEHYDFNHKRQAIANILVLKIKSGNDSVKDSVYAIKYKRYNIIGINTFEIDAKDVYEALRQFERHVIENAWGTANVNIISVSPNDGDMRLYGQLSKLLKEHANDSERRVYTFEYQEKKTGKTHSFRCTAPDAEEARNQLQEWAAEHDEEPYKILSTNMTYDSTAPADLERIPLEARKEMKEAKDKKATLIGIAGQMQDIINRADKIEKDDLRAKAKKILSDLKVQFNIKEADFITVDTIKDARWEVGKRVKYDGEWYYIINYARGNWVLENENDRSQITVSDTKDELIQSSSEEAFKKNIATEIKAGKDPKQAAAIAYSVKRENDSLKRFEIQEGDNITIVRAKDLADAIKKVSK